MDGSDATLLVYGQTSSGKTYTMGSSSFDDIHKGIISRTLEMILSFKNQKYNETEMDIKLSAVEIYNEEVKDLIDHSKMLNIRINKHKLSEIDGCKEENIQNIDDADNLLKIINEQKTFGATGKNLFNLC